MDFTGISILGQRINVKDAVARTLLNNLQINASLTEMVFLGDSFSQGEFTGGTHDTVTICDMLADKLKLNAHNYGVGGAGYTVPGNLLQTQLTNAIADTTYDHTKVKYVFIEGGFNDIINASASPNTVNTASNLLVSACKSAFINATIVIVPNWAQTYIDPINHKVFEDICRITDDARVVTLKDQIRCLMGWKNLVSTDNVHPTHAGYVVFANNIYAHLQGGFISRSKPISITGNANWDISNLYAFLGEKDVRVFGNIKANSDIDSSKLEVCTLDPDACFFADTFKYSARSNTTAECIMQLQPGDNRYGLEQSPKLVLYTDFATTILANETIAIDITIPLFSY